MMMRFKFAPTCAAIICSLTLLGCSSTALESPKQENRNAFVTDVQASEQLSRTTSCCNTVNELEYQPLNKDDVQYVAFDKDSSTFNFEQGKSFYKAYQLDKNINELKVEVSGLIYNTVFAPQILLLDSQFNKTRVISADKLSYKEAKLLSGNELTLNFSIKRPNLSNPANEKYFIIYTTDKAMQGETTVTHPAKLDARGRSNAEPDIADPIIRHSAMGVVKLGFDMQSNNDSYIAPEPQKVVTIDAKDMLTEAQYNQQILTAVADGAIEKALLLVDQAEAAGSKSARTTFVEAIKK